MAAWTFAVPCDYTPHSPLNDFELFGDLREESLAPDIQLASVFDERQDIVLRAREIDRAEAIEERLFQPRQSREFSRPGVPALTAFSRR